MFTKNSVAFVILVSFVSLATIFLVYSNTTVPVVTGHAFYQCGEGRTVNAVFTEKGPVPVGVAGEPPVSNASVSLGLNGARSITLPQALSADGARYANADESLVFWSKGSGAMVLENGKEMNYKSCILVKDDDGDLSHVYLNEVNHFTLRYPDGYVPNTAYTYRMGDPDVSLAGISFVIPESMAAGTNLSKDSYLSIEHRAGSGSCSANNFLQAAQGTKAFLLEDGDRTYSVASSTGAGAGNRYEEYVYALADSNPCLAVRYFIHYTAIENYDAGTITQFNKQELLKQFDSIRKSLTIGAQMSWSSIEETEVYPLLYGNVSWQEEKDTQFSGMKGHLVVSDTLPNITDISAVTLPFEKYYATLLGSEGWKEDISMAAGGPGSAVIAYKKDDDYIVLQYKSEFSVSPKNQPAQCPCSVQFSVFSTAN